MVADQSNQRPEFCATYNQFTLIAVVDENLKSAKFIDVLAGIFDRFLQRAEGLVLRLCRPAMHCAWRGGIHRKLVSHIEAVRCN